MSVFASPQRRPKSVAPVATPLRPITGGDEPRAPHTREPRTDRKPRPAPRRRSLELLGRGGKQPRIECSLASAAAAIAAADDDAEPGSPLRAMSGGCAPRAALAATVDDAVVCAAREAPRHAASLVLEVYIAPARRLEGMPLSAEATVLDWKRRLVALGHFEDTARVALLDEADAELDDAAPVAALDGEGVFTASARGGSA